MNDKAYALAWVAAVNSTGAPLIVPPAMIQDLHGDPDFDQLISEGKIVPNLPIKNNK